MKKYRVALLALILALGCGSSPTNPPPIPQAPAGQIVFSGCPPGGPNGLYAMKPDGRDVHLLIANAGDVTPSPDGQSIAFTRVTEAAWPYSLDLFVATANGTNERRLTYGAGVHDWAWSPRGNWIVTSTGANTTSVPFWLVIHVADAAVDTLFRGLVGRIAERNPWSPDESTILYQEDVPNTQTANVRAIARDSHVTRLVVENGWDPFFGPDADRIYFHRNQDNEIWTATTNGQDQHHCITATGSWHLSPDRTKVAIGALHSCTITLHALGTCQGAPSYEGVCASGSEPVCWSPDGRFLLAATYSPDAILILNTTDRRTTPFTAPAFTCGDYAWMP